MTTTTKKDRQENKDHNVSALEKKKHKHILFITSGLAASVKANWIGIINSSLMKTSAPLVVVEATSAERCHCSEKAAIHTLLKIERVKRDMWII